MYNHMDWDNAMKINCMLFYFHFSPLFCLQLTGANLDEVEKKDSPTGKAEKLDAIFEKIKCLLVQEKLQR